MIDMIPKWIEDMDDEDLTFIKNFLISSGSLKQMSKMYNVTYPTMRLRLDRLIQKIELNDNDNEDSFISLVKRLAIEDKFDVTIAKTLISAYKKEKRRNE